MRSGFRGGVGRNTSPGERIRCAALETRANRETAIRYGVETIPQVLVFRSGEVLARFFGRTKLASVRAAVAEALETACSSPGAIEEPNELALEHESRLRSVYRHRSSVVPPPRLPPLERSLALSG